MAAHPDFAKIAALLHADGVDGSTTFVDSSASPKTVTAYNGAQISTADFAFGGSSFYFPSSAAHARITPAADFAIGAADFTVQCRVKYSSHSGARPFGLFAGSAGILQIYISGGALGVETNNAYGGLGGSVPRDEWVPLEVSRASGVVRSFINGVKVYEYTDNNPLSEPTHVNINQYANGGGYGGVGYVDEVCITIGLALNTANFTPLTEAYGAAATLSGHIADAANAPAVRLVRAIREDTGVLVGYITSDAGTGAYSIATPHGGAHTLIAYPAAGESLPALTLRGVLPV